MATGKNKKKKMARGVEAPPYRVSLDYSDLHPYDAGFDVNRPEGAALWTRDPAESAGMTGTTSSRSATPLFQKQEKLHDLQGTSNLGTPTDIWSVISGPGNQLAPGVSPVHKPHLSQGGFIPSNVAAQPSSAPVAAPAAPKAAPVAPKAAPAPAAAKTPYGSLDAHMAAIMAGKAALPAGMEGLKGGLLSDGTGAAQSYDLVRNRLAPLYSVAQTRGLLGN